MSRRESRGRVWALVACLGFWVFLGQGQEASANLRYQGSWENKEDEQGRLLQSHAQGVALNLNQDLSARLVSEEHANYSFRWEQEGTVRETLSPGASLGLSGDIFLARLAVNSTKNLNNQAAQTDSDRLALTWASSWHKRFIPDLAANYDYLSQAAGDRKSIGTEINWNLLVAKLSYSYRRSDSTLQGYQEVSDSNLATVSASRVWLDGRLQVSLGHQYNKTTNERRIPFIDSTTVDVVLTLSQADTGTDTTPGDTDDSMLVAAPFLLNDANRLLPVPSAYSVTAAGSPNCIRLRSNGQQVDRVFLYTQANLGSAPTGVTWRVYTNDDFLINSWKQVADFAWHYDSSNQRFVIDLPAVRETYVKLVVDLAGPDTINFTGVQAEQVVRGDLGSTSADLRTSQTEGSNINLDFRLNKAVGFFYGFSMNQGETDGVTVSVGKGHNGGVRMQNSGGDLKSTLTYLLSRQRNAADLEMQTEMYQLTVNKDLFSTLALALSGSQEQSSLDGAKVSTRNRYTFYTDARLYPDLTSRLETVYWVMKNFAVEGADSDSLSTKIAFTSRFSPSLNVSLYGSYDVQDQPGLVSKVNNCGLWANWQVSDLLLLYFSVSQTNGNLDPVSYAYTTGLTAGMGSGLELKASYSLQTAESKSQSGQTSLRWTSIKNVFCEIGCAYAESDSASARNVYKFYSRFAVNFAMF